MRQKKMLDDPTITREKRGCALLDDIFMQPGKVGRHFPEELLKPEPAGEESHQREQQETPFAQENGMIDFLEMTSFCSNS